jgi:acyl-CoA synthetase (AMP-forming)/AMP-acid ligase II
VSGNLADRFEQVVDEHGERIAVDTGTSTLTYDELDARANRFAAWLRSVGVQAGDRVGLALWNRVEHLDALLGAFKARAVPVNVNFHYTAPELETLLTDADVRVVVHEGDLTAAIEQAGIGHRWLRLGMGADYEAALAGESPDRISEARRGDYHYILYTGGTTGTPKGVVWRHEDLAAAVLSSADGDRLGTRMLPACPLIHGTAQWTTLATLLGGGLVVFGELHGLDPVALWNRVEQAEVTRLVIVGDAFARPLLDALDAEPDRWDLSSLVVISSGGARWSTTTRRGLLDHLPHAAMVNGFGASETGGQGTDVSFAGQDLSSEPGLLRFQPDDTTLVIDEDRHAIAAGSDKVGFLARRGPVPLGYLGDPARSAQTFPIVDGARYAVPGDMAMVEPDGSIVVLGRDRNVINTGGEKVFAEHVEAALVEHPAVADAVVAGVPDERWGERVTALVALRPGATVDEATLLAHCRAKLARFKVPRQVIFCERIKRRHTGKLDRNWAADTMTGRPTVTKGNRGP